MAKLKNWEKELYQRFIDGDDVLTLVSAYSKQFKHCGESRPMYVRKRIVENILRAAMNENDQHIRNYGEEI